MTSSIAADRPATSFADLGLSPSLLRALADEGYTTPTPIQTKAVPHVLAGRDLFGCAQTGTGKTAAFALPLIERMRATDRQPAPRRCRTLVLAPTRELAAQIHESFLAYGRHARIRAAVIYGGVGQHQQAKAMMNGVDVLVATPGRLLDLVGQRLVDIRSVEFLVLDEADRMLDMGFIHDMRRIVAMLPVDRQTLFFSATLPAEVRSLAATMLRDPLEVKTAPQSTPAETVDQSVVFVPKKDKKSMLVKLLREEATGRVIVFARTKHGADKLHRDLAKAGIDAAAIHGNKSQAQRERALKAFKSPQPPVLVATDIAARGIDVDEVAHVINFELPHEPETYVHRIGRTGRAGQTGAAVSLCDAEERSRLVAIERLLRRSIPARNAPPVGHETHRDDEGRDEGRRGAAPAARQARRPQGRRDRSRPAAVGAPARESSAQSDSATVAATATVRPAARPGRRKHRRAL
ncbi:MAG: DEAD/DEAH box helicase [Pirellulales bacterium]